VNKSWEDKVCSDLRHERTALDSSRGLKKGGLGYFRG